METTGATVIGEDVGDVALRVAAQDAAVAHGIDPLALMAALRTDQHGHRKRLILGPTRHLLQSLSHRTSRWQSLETNGNGGSKRRVMVEQLVKDMRGEWEAFNF